MNRRILSYESSPLRNNLCRLQSVGTMAGVQSHLRSYAVAETIGFLGTLDSHPKIKAKPTVSKGPAIIQQNQGSIQNPFAHALPNNLVINDRSLQDYFSSSRARTVVERVFSMGVMAPDNWECLGSFDVSPRQMNIVDNIAEAYRTEYGLVNAFVSTAEKSVSRGTWNASGKHQHNLSSLADLIYHHHKEFWQPLASQAYSDCQGHLQAKLKEAKTSNDAERENKIEHRLQILREQIKIHEHTVNPVEVAKQIVSSIQEEKWK